MDKVVRLESCAFIGLWAGSVVLTLLSTARAWLATTTALTLVFLVAYWWARGLADGLTVKRERRYGWAHVGDLLEEQFTVRNRAPLPALWIEIQDRSTLPGYQASMVTAAGGGEERRLRLQGVCQQRGVFDLGPWRVQTSDPFGLFRVVLDYPQVTSFAVYPSVAHLPDIELPRGDAPGRARRHERSQTDTTDARGVRSYTPGDPLRQVHWPTTARRGELFVKEFDLEPLGDLWILLDLDRGKQAGEGADSTEEVGVTIAASLAHAALSENRAVGLAVSGERPALLEPNKSRAQLWQILRALARARAGGDVDITELLRQVRTGIARGLTVSVITPACTSDWLVELLALKGLGVASTVILLDPVSFGGSGNAAAMRSLLADFGIQCQIIKQGMPLPPVFQVEQQRRPEYRVGAAGRLIGMDGR